MCLRIDFSFWRGFSISAQARLEAVSRLVDLYCVCSNIERRIIMFKKGGFRREDGVMVGGETRVKIVFRGRFWGGALWWYCSSISCKWFSIRVKLLICAVRCYGLSCLDVILIFFIIWRILLSNLKNNINFIIVIKNVLEDKIFLKYFLKKVLFFITCI